MQKMKFQSFARSIKKSLSLSSSKIFSKFNFQSNLTSTIKNKFQSQRSSLNIDEKIKRN